MLLRILGLLLLIPLFDMVVLVAVATQTPLGWVGAVALVVLTALIGMLLVRAEGRHTAQKIQSQIQRGSLPGDELLDGGLLIAAGAFLLTPGLVTDLVGLVLVVPVTRWPVRKAIKRWLVIPYLDRKMGGIASGVAYGGGFPDEEDTYDVDAESYEVHDPDGDPSRE
ncbi:FxsA family protein [Halococcus sediminicola]|uniref:FxsA family protein n=1 Tax=Halococcus sediminicola TaxID=1264579 RepID=UPI0006794F1F|nr:FxsA family protein [Halococcus sediminicola]